jgi:epoxyqueuosine reductase QueG
MRDTGMRELERDIRGFLCNETHFQGIAVVNQSSSGGKLGVPQSVLKGANSIICYGVKIPKGVIYAEKNDLTVYWRYCNTQYRALDAISNKLSTFLEDKEGLAVPIYSCFPWVIKNREFLGSLPLVYWAEEAGLGRISKCGLLVTRQCGTRILLGAVLTTLELKPNEKLGDDICPTACFECVDICPAKAIKRTGKVDHNSCIRYSSSNPLLKLVLDNKTTRENYSFETILNTVAIDDHGAYLCFKCMKACPLNKR